MPLSGGMLPGINPMLVVAKRLSRRGMMAMAPALMVVEDGIDEGKVMMMEALTEAEAYVYEECLLTVTCKQKIT
jgi:hypothetical protein